MHRKEVLFRATTGDVGTTALGSFSLRLRSVSAPDPINLGK